MRGPGNEVDNLYGLFTKRVANMAGYWLVDRDGVEVHKHAKRTKSISSHLELTSLVYKRFIIWKKNITFLRGSMDNPEQAG